MSLPQLPSQCDNNDHTEYRERDEDDACLISEQRQTADVVSRIEERRRSTPIFSRVSEDSSDKRTEDEERWPGRQRGQRSGNDGGSEKCEAARTASEHYEGHHDE